MNDGDSWRELHRTRDFREAATIATCLAAMEFDATLVDGLGREVSPEIVDDLKEPFCVRVPVEDAVLLHEVLEEIIAEQTQFDRLLARRHQNEDRRNRQTLLVLIAIVASLAALGLIEL